MYRRAADGRPYLNPGFVMKSVIGPLMTRAGRFPVLTVEGRTSGKPRSVPIGAPLQLDGHRYLVSARGQTHWILNLRAAGCGTLRQRGISESFRAVEVDGAERDRVIAAYRAALGKSVEPAFAKLPDPSDHPTFRLEDIRGRIRSNARGRLR
jgi:deazaflavin-dependent oxidoreductase (nitroreductase family)